MKPRDISLAIVVVFIWGSYFTASKITLLSFPPLLAGGLRFFLLFLLTLPFLFQDKPPLKKILCLSGAYVVSGIAVYQAILSNSGIAPIIFIYQLNVPISILLGLVVFKEKIAFKDYIGILLSLIGLSIVTQIFSASGIGIVPVILSVCSALFFSFYMLMAKSLSSFNIFTILSRLSLFACPVFLLFSYYFETWPTLEMVKARSVIALVYKALICGLFANLGWIYLLRKYSLIKLMPFSLLTPIFGCIITAIVFDENIELSTLLGGLMIMIGIAIIEMKKV
jgi:O-acetylserine/cysteine efflux transporter